MKKTKTSKKKSISVQKNKKTANASKLQLQILFVLLILTFSLSIANIAKAQGYFIPFISDGISIDDNAIQLDSLTLEQKIGQMIIVHGSTYNIDEWQKMNIGGFHLFAMESAEIYKATIDSFQENSQIPFFVTTDLEGCQNSFANFQEFTPNDQITTVEQATQKGTTEAKFLNELGFSINFAPIVDLEDSIWGCRSFPGDQEQITILADAYISALQTADVSATIKHYPGKTLVVSDPHQNLVTATIEAEDIFPYQELMSITEQRTKQEVIDLVMVSHLITTGTVDSNGLPSTVSPSVILQLKENYQGLIISDDTIMRGLLDFYGDDTDQLYLDLVLAGHDLIINFNEDPNEIYRMIEVITEGVEQNIIQEAQIDTTVTKILELKGFIVE
ncbi:hypothetical protein HOC96_01015 [archaeon]|nr:hypothetical protein [archaeon]